MAPAPLWPLTKALSPEPKRTLNWKKWTLRAQKAIALDAHISFDIHTRMLIFLFQYHVVGRAHDNYSACEYWHLLWFEFAVLFYLRNNSPDMKKSYKALFHTWHDRNTFSLGITWNWLTTVNVNQLLRMCIISLPCRMNYVWLGRPTFKIHKLCK